MMPHVSSFRVLLLASIGHSLADVIPIAGGKYAMHWVRNISIHRPGYTQMPPEVPGKMIITSFEGTPFVAKHAVYALDLAEETTSMPKMLPGSDAIDWPNAATGIPKSVFGFEAVAVGNGFLVPSHATGGVWIMEATASPAHLSAPLKITKDEHGWFYHMTYFVDWNNDGRLDILTSRCEYGILPWSKKRGELLWLEQPATAPLSGEPWAEHHLADGPDFLFCVHPNEKWLAAAEFVAERIVLYERLSNGTLHHHVLDDHSGPGFGCSWKDLNGDGRMELLVTNHLNQNGSVYAYEFDGDDFAKSGVRRHVLATGFNAISDSQGTASPGDAVAFRPMASAANEKPHILVSGDNSNSLFMLVPESQANTSWTYIKQEIAFLGADIGRPSFSVGEDGFVDLYVPAYDNDAIVHYKFTAAVQPTNTVLV